MALLWSGILDLANGQSNLSMPSKLKAVLSAIDGKWLPEEWLPEDLRAFAFLPDVVDVPLDPEQDGYLNWLWLGIVDLAAKTSTIEEIFAVWASLKIAHAEGSITAAYRRTLEKEYKKLYGDTLKEFPTLYDKFSKSLGHLSVENAALIARAALDIFEGETALEVIIERCRGVGDDVHEVLEAIMKPYVLPFDRPLEDVFAQPEEFAAEDLVPLILSISSTKRLYKAPPSLHFHFAENGVRFSFLAERYRQEREAWEQFHQLETPIPWGLKLLEDV